MDSTALQDAGFDEGYSEEWDKLSKGASEETTLNAEKGTIKQEPKKAEAEVIDWQKIAKDHQAAFTKKSQENAELKGRLDQIEIERLRTSTPSKGQPTTEDLENMSDAKLSKTVENFPELADVAEYIRELRGEIETLKKKEPAVEVEKVRKIIAKDEESEAISKYRDDFYNVILPEVKEDHEDAGDILKDQAFYDWVNESGLAAKLDQRDPKHLSYALSKYKASNVSNSGNGKKTGQSSLMSSIGSSSKSTEVRSKDKPKIENFNDENAYYSAAWDWNKKHPEDPAY